MTWHVFTLPKGPKTNGRPLRDQIRAIIDEADRNGDGILTKEEVKKAFSDLGSWIPGWRASWGIEYADTDGDGRISGDYEINKLVDYAFEKFGVKQ